MNTIKKPSLVSLFCGGGGSSIGYKAAGYDIRLAVDWDKDAATTYQQNFPDTPFWQGDIGELSSVEALTLAGVEKGELDVLDGSPPCQGFSAAGTRHLGDQRNRLFEEYVRLLTDFQPKAFIMENVSGLRKGKMKLAFAEITRALKACGYKVSCRELNAWWYGTPQDRRRLLWVGIRGDIEAIPSHPEPMLRKPITVRQALGAYSLNRYGGEKNQLIRQENNVVFRSTRSVDTPSFTQLASGPNRLLRYENHTEATLIESRYITLEEAKILQGFPGWFQVGKYKIIGNSVPPPMAEAVGRHVIKLLAGII
jgi:DNA (cytosine-5)-methyltransferase 1